MVERAREQVAAFNGGDWQGLRAGLASDSRYEEFGTPTEPEHVRGAEGAISRAVNGLASHMTSVIALATHTRSGRSALLLSKERPPLPIYALYPSRKHLSAKVRRFVEFLLERFAQAQDWSAA